jgi:hypothetical protein
VKGPALQLNPAIHQSKKRQSKTNRARSGQAKKPFVRNIAPQGSRDCQRENTHGHCHHHKQEREKIKAKWASPEEWDQSVCAKSEAIQDQKPGFALCAPPNAGRDGASACRKCEPTQNHSRAIPLMERQGASRASVVHDQVDDRNYQVKNATQC